MAKSLVKAFSTGRGTAYLSSVEDFLQSPESDRFRGKVNLLLTSPPFPLRAKKAYGNLEGEEYLLWLSAIMAKAGEMLSEDGSLVIEIGNSWDPGQPTMSVLPLQALLAIAEETGFFVCQQFIAHNPARLPGPAQWVTVKRIRVKDTYTHVWWFAKSPWVDADNKRVLVPYSDSMKKLLKRKKYNSGSRPSGHLISEDGFSRDHGGAIPSNVLSFSNTSDDAKYIRWCKNLGVKPHPARMPLQLVRFFTEFLTDEGDLVWDCFAGSLTTAAVAEESNRTWLATEMESDYLQGGLGRFSFVADSVSAGSGEFKAAVKTLKSE